MTTLDEIKDYQMRTGSAYQVFPKLCSDNYFSWSASMELVLHSLSQWEVVTGILVGPVCADPNAPTDKNSK